MSLQFHPRTLVILVLLDVVVDYLGEIERPAPNSLFRQMTLDGRETSVA